MIRALLILIGVIALPVGLVGRTDDLTDSLMRDLRGGNITKGKETVDCDDEAGVYLGCAAAGADCTQCVVVNEDDTTSTTTADRIINGGNPGPTGYEYKQNPQDCGFQYKGKCVADPNSPTGFTCDGRVTTSICTVGIFQVGPQPPPVPKPPFGWQPQ